MSVEILIATMNQKDYALLKKMHINSNVIIGNQSNLNKVEETVINGYSVKCLTFNEIGVGLNRNNCLMRASSDFCVFADDDIIFEDNYCELIESEFKKLPKADVIIFNIYENPITRYVNKKRKKVRFFKSFRYGAVRIAIRLKSIREAGIFFNLSFGGGCKYSHGEDVLFIQECLRKKLKIYTSPIYISKLDNCRDSTWFKGYDDKFFIDHAALYYQVSKRFWKLLCFQDAIRHSKKYGKKFIDSYKKMLQFRKKEDD